MSQEDWDWGKVRKHQFNTARELINGSIVTGANANDYVVVFHNQALHADAILANVVDPHYTEGEVYSVQMQTDLDKQKLRVVPTAEVNSGTPWRAFVVLALWVAFTAVCIGTSPGEWPPKSVHTTLAIVPRADQAELDFFMDTQKLFGEGNYTRHEILVLIEPIKAGVNVAPVDPCTATNIGCIINDILKTHFEPLTTGITYSTGALYEGSSVIAGTDYIATAPITIGNYTATIGNTTNVPTALALVTLAYRTHSDNETVQLVVDVEREFKAQLSELATVQVVPAKQHIEHVAEHGGGHFDWGTIATAAIGLAILGWHIGAFKAVSITFVNIFLVHMCSFRVAGWYTDHEAVLTFGPEIMLAVIVAFCIDYSLFIVKPYCIASRENKVYSSASAWKVFKANYLVVLLSCGVLVACFLTLMWVHDIKALSSLAVTCCFTVLLTTLANLTVTPALLSIRTIRRLLLPSPRLSIGMAVPTTYLTRKLMPREADRAHWRAIGGMQQYRAVQAEHGKEASGTGAAALVGAVYLAYVVVIVLALAGEMPLRETVTVCLSLHFVGLAGSKLYAGKFYEDNLLQWQFRTIAIWDIIQLGLWLALLVGYAATESREVNEAAAYATLVGIVGCLYKVAHRFARYERAGIYRKSILFVYFAITIVATMWVYGAYNGTRPDAGTMHALYGKDSPINLAVAKINSRYGAGTTSAGQVKVPCADVCASNTMACLSREANITYTLTQQAANATMYKIKPPYDLTSSRGTVWLYDTLPDAEKDCRPLGPLGPRVELGPMPQGTPAGVADAELGNMIIYFEDQLSTDAINDIWPKFEYKIVPTLIGIVVVVVYMSFGTAWFPLFAVSGLVSTFSVGLALLRVVYPDSHTNYFSKPTPGAEPLAFVWFVAIMVVPITVGIMLDYVILRLERYRESLHHNERGWYKDWYASIHYSAAEVTHRRGVARVGTVHPMVVRQHIHDALVDSTGTVRTAGLIMVIAFSGLLMESAAAAHQIAVMLIACLVWITGVNETVVQPIIKYELAAWAHYNEENFLNRAFQRIAGKWKKDEAPQSPSATLTEGDIERAQLIPTPLPLRRRVAQEVVLLL